MGFMRSQKKTAASPESTSSVALVDQEPIEQPGSFPELTPREELLQAERDLIALKVEAITMPGLAGDFDKAGQSYEKLFDIPERWETLPTAIAKQRVRVLQAQLKMTEAMRPEYEREYAALTAEEEALAARMRKLRDEKAALYQPRQNLKHTIDHLQRAIENLSERIQINIASLGKRALGTVKPGEDGSLWATHPDSERARVELLAKQIQEIRRQLAGDLDMPGVKAACPELVEALATVVGLAERANRLADFVQTSEVKQDRTRLVEPFGGVKAEIDMIESQVGLLAASLKVKVQGSSTSKGGK